MRTTGPIGAATSYPQSVDGHTHMDAQVFWDRSVSRMQTVDFQIHFSARRSFSGPFDSVQP